LLLLPYAAAAATVVASTYCELYSLSRADLEEVLQQWPELAEEFEAMGKSCSSATIDHAVQPAVRAVALAGSNLVAAAVARAGRGV
jgi:CRP-like cAMP-binding protein